MSSSRTSLHPPRTAALLTLAIFVVLMGATWVRHTDVGDAQVYQVIARHMLEDHSWVSLRYLPAVHGRFYEHLPFGFWPMAATIRLFGEWALIPLCALLSLGTVLLAGAAARRLAGPWSGLLAMLVLGTTESFFTQASYPTLDPMLIFLATGAGAIVLVGEGSGRHWLFAGLLAAAAAAVKGPFGLLPLFGAALGRAVVDRSWQFLFRGALTSALAAVPALAFLALRGDWWEGYGVHQIFFSITGARPDGASHPLYLLRVLVGRFWPGLPLLIPAIILAVGWPARAAQRIAGEENQSARRACQLSLIAAAVVIVAVSIPQRKIWHHAWVAYPFLAIACGAGVGPTLAAYFSQRGRILGAVVGLGAILAVSLAAVFGGLERLLMQAPCVIAREFAVPLREIAPDEEVLVVSNRDEWDILSALAFEKRATPWPTAELDGSQHRSARFAFVAADRWSGNGEWTEVGRARGWVLARRPALGTAPR
jgi:4-amino-4-deoxy-L-arabinose transferase-like glycosyltransferase